MSSKTVLQLRELVLICPIAPLPSGNMGFRTASSCVRRPRNPQGCHKDQRRFFARQQKSCITMHPPPVVSFYPSMVMQRHLALSVCAFASAGNLEHLPDPLPLPPGGMIGIFALFSHSSLRCGMWTLVSEKSLAEKGSELRGAAGSFKPR
jgi:hypothetical protein